MMILDLSTLDDGVRAEWAAALVSLIKVGSLRSLLVDRSGADNLLSQSIFALDSERVNYRNYCTIFYLIQ